MPAPGSERIYSVSQLSEALQSGLMGLKDQLQVLSILDGSSTCWPGVSAAQADLEQLVKLAGQHLAELEKQSRHLAAANTKLQDQNSQLGTKLKAATADKQRTQESLDQQIQTNSNLQSRLDTAQEAAQKAQQQLQQLQQSNAQLVQQAAKQAAEAELLQGELAGLRQREMQLREQVAVQQEQLAATRQELAVRTTELSHTSSSLQEHKDSLAHTRSQLASVQDNLTGQLKALQRELAATQNDKLQADREVGRLSQEVADVAASLEKAYAEVDRLKEWQDIFKRMADDKAQEAAQELEACKARAADRQLAAAGEVLALQKRLTARDDQVANLQKELSLLQLHVREAQRAQGAAAEAQAAASKALDQQECELAALRQQLKDAQLGLERSRADHLAAESATQQAAAAVHEQLSTQLEQAQREVAVKQALCDGWQRANQALQDRVKQLEAAATTTAATTDTSMPELRIQLEAERAEARKAKMEASSTSKQFEQLVQRRRREADASAEEVCRLRSIQATLQSAQAAASTRSPSEEAGTAAAAVSPHIHQELMQLHRAMYTISGNLQAAEATMQQMASAAQLQGMAPGQQASADLWAPAAAPAAAAAAEVHAQLGQQIITEPGAQRPGSMKLIAPAALVGSAAKATAAVSSANGKGSRKSTAAATTTKAAGSSTNPRSRQALGTRG